MPPKNPKKKDHADSDEKKGRKKGKTKVAGRTVPKSRQEPSTDSGDPELDIERAMTMKAKSLQFQMTAPSSLMPPPMMVPPHALGLP